MTVRTPFGEFYISQTCYWILSFVVNYGQNGIGGRVDYISLIRLINSRCGGGSIVCLNIDSFGFRDNVMYIWPGISFILCRAIESRLGNSLARRQITSAFTFGNFFEQHRVFHNPLTANRHVCVTTNKQQAPQFHTHL